MSEEQKKREKQNIEVSIDTKRTEELARENERLKMEQERKENSEDDLADRKIQAYQKFHNERFLDATSKEELSNMLTAHINAIAEKARGTPSGHALTPQQMGEKGFDLYSHKFESEKAMVDFCYEHMHDETPLGKEADSYITEMLRKWAHEFRNKREQRFFDPNLRENLPALRTTPEGFQVAADPNEADIKKVLNKWRMQNPRIRKAVEQLNAGENPQQRES